MNLKLKKTLVCLFALGGFCASAQLSEYRYSRPLSGIKDQWHSIVLPQEMYAHVSPSYADLKIIGITSAHDTIEAPYTLQTIGAEHVKFKTPIPAKIINRSRNDKGSYFTLEVPDDLELNNIALDFKQQNFDWKVTLEGSHDQKEWFTIVAGHRILSIHNADADYSFTRLTFPDSKYRYFRLFIPGSQTADLNSAFFPHQKTIAGKSKQYPVTVLAKKEDKRTGRTTIDLELSAPAPLNLLKVYIQNRYDYFRLVTVECLTDSFKTEQGWKYNYALLKEGTLNSIDGNELQLNTTLVNRLRVIIENNDNDPLTIDSFVVKGPEYELIARFTRKANYFLVYGNSNEIPPNYDLVQFLDNIPGNPAPLTLGEEVSLFHDQQPQTAPLFENKVWLWIIMAVVIVVIGWFSLSMMRNVK
jgi:hypothetical protein